MVFIPSFRRQSIGVSPSLPRENLTIPPGAFDNQQFKSLLSLGRSGLQLGKILSDRAEKVDLERDNITADGAFNRLYEQQTPLFSEARITQGVNAAQVTQRFTEQYDELANNGFLELQNDRQRDLYTEKVQSLKRNRQTFLSNHEAKQFQSAIKSNMAAESVNAQTEAGINFENDGIFDQKRQEAIISRNNQLVNEGVPSTARELDLRSLNGKLQGQRILQFANSGNLNRANVLLDQNKEELGKLFEPLKTKLDGMVFRERVQAKTDEIFLRVNGDEDLALKLVRDETDGKEEDAVRSLLKSRFTDDRNIEARTDKIIFSSLYNGIRNSTTLDQAMRIAGQGRNPTQINSLERQAQIKYRTQNKPVQRSQTGLTLELMERIDRSNDGRIKETDPKFIGDITDVEILSAGKLTLSDRRKVEKYLEDGGEAGRLGLDKVVPIWNFYKNTQADLKNKVTAEDIANLREFILRRSPSGKDITEADMLELGKSYFTEGVIGLQSAVEEDTFFVDDPNPIAFEEAVRTGREKEFFVRTEDITDEERQRALNFIAIHNRRPEIQANPSRQWDATEENVIMVVTRKIRGIGRALRLR